MLLFLCCKSFRVVGGVGELNDMDNDSRFNGFELFVKGCLVCDVKEPGFISCEILKDDEIRA